MCSKYEEVEIYIATGISRWVQVEHALFEYG